MSNFPSFDAPPGMDVLSLILTMLTTPHSMNDDYSGVTIISSAGDYGNGYETVGLPNLSPLGSLLVQLLTMSMLDMVLSKINPDLEILIIIM
ncbi:MAG: hypothetical protein ACRBB5_03995 [Nitrosopumilus sp.]